MMRLYSATGDGIARLDQLGDTWTVQLSLVGSGAQCLAVDPADGDVVYAGLRESGLRRTRDAGRTWVDCALTASENTPGSGKSQSTQVRPPSPLRRTPPSRSPA